MADGVEFDEALFPSLTFSVKLHVQTFWPEREWHCGARAAEVSPDDAYEMHTWCMVDGGVYGFTVVFPAAAINNDVDEDWVTRVTHFTVNRMRSLLARLN